MISLFVNKFRDSYASRLDTAKNNEIKKKLNDERRFEELEKDLHRDDQVETKIKRSEMAAPAEFQFNCIKKQGETEDFLLPILIDLFSLKASSHHWTKMEESSTKIIHFRRLLPARIGVK